MRCAIMIPAPMKKAEVWRPIARACGVVTVVVLLFYLATVNERMLDDLRMRAVAAHALAHRCVATMDGREDYAEVVRLEARIFRDDARTCPLPSTADEKDMPNST